MSGWCQTLLLAILSKDRAAAPGASGSPQSTLDGHADKDSETIKWLLLVTVHGWLHLAEFRIVSRCLQL